MNDITPIEDTELTKVLDSMPEADRKVIIERMGVILASSKSFSGPLPAPEDMRQYEEIHKGSADRIITAYETQINHRVKQEAKIIENEGSQIKRGQILGFILCIFFGAGAIYLGTLGHAVLAGTICTVLIIALAVIFVLNQYPTFMDNKKDKR